MVGTHRTEQYDDEPTVIEKVTDSPWFVPLLLTLLALLLILGAYAVGRAFADKVNDDAGASSEPQGIVTSEGGSSKARQPVSTQAPGKGAWDGKVTPVKGVSASATCTSPPGQDASGGKVSYGADQPGRRRRGHHLALRRGRGRQEDHAAAAGGDLDRRGGPDPGLREDRRRQR